MTVFVSSKFFYFLFWLYRLGFPKKFTVYTSVILMWACVGECLAHISRHKACTERLMDNVISIVHLIRSILEVAGSRTPTNYHPWITSPTSCQV